MLNKTARRTPLHWALSSSLAKARHESAAGVMLVGQSIELSHAQTTVDDHGGAGPRTGTTEWSANVMGRRVWLSWAWVEVMRDVLALSNPMGIATNARLHASDGEALVDEAIVLELNRIVCFLPRQPEVLAALVWEEKNATGSFPAKAASGDERSTPRQREPATRQPSAPRVRASTHRGGSSGQIHGLKAPNLSVN